MNRIGKKISRYRYAVLAALCIFACLLNVFPKWNQILPYPNQCLFFAGFVAVMIFYILFSAKKDSFSERDIIFIIFALGFVFRLVYGISTDFYVRQHDLDVNYPSGHYAYIKRFYFGEGLPEVNTENSWQFYQPPAWHFLCAVFLRIQTFLKIPIKNAFENLQMISLFCSSAMMFLSYRLFKMFGLKDVPLCIACSIVAFHPTFIILSASINNDILSITLSLVSVILALKWYREPKLKTIVILALSIGISMAVKISAGLVSVGIATLFAIRLFGKKHKNKLNLVGQFSLFGVICVPIALWWQIRNLILFNVPITYVPKLSEMSNQYIGFRTVSERLFDFSSLSESVYPLRVLSSQTFEYFEYNIPLGALKTSVFGEYYLGQNSKFTLIFANILFWTAFVIAVLAIIGAVLMIFRAFKDKKCENFLPSELIFTLICIFTIVVSYLKFCFDYAHFCTMDFRYITLCIVFGALYLGLLLNDVSKNNKMFGKVMLYASGINVFMFILSSVVIYGTIA